MLGEMQALSNAVAGFPPGAGRKALIDLVAPLDFAGQIGAAQARFLSEASGLADDALLTALVPVAAAYARPPLSNVFIGADGTYKLGDLNVSKVLKKGLAYTQTGTPYYASPEVWQDLPYDMKSDIWSLGCVIYEMAAL